MGLALGALGVHVHPVGRSLVWVFSEPFGWTSCWSPEAVSKYTIYLICVSILTCFFPFLLSPPQVMDVLLQYFGCYWRETGFPSYDPYNWGSQTFTIFHILHRRHHHHQLHTVSPWKGWLSTSSSLSTTSKLDGLLESLFPLWWLAVISLQAGWPSTNFLSPVHICPDHHCPGVFPDHAKRGWVRFADSTEPRTLIEVCMLIFRCTVE